MIVSSDRRAAAGSCEGTPSTGVVEVDEADGPTLSSGSTTQELSGDDEGGGRSHRLTMLERLESVGAMTRRRRDGGTEREKRPKVHSSGVHGVLLSRSSIVDAATR
jgi:hypothetical protein